LGGCSCPVFAALTAARQSCGTRLREKTASQVVAVLGASAYGRAALSELGADRSHPCRPPVRRVSGRWGATWSHSLTNVRAPQHLSAREGCAV